MFSGPLSNVYFLSKPLNLIGCHGNQKAKFAKNIQKSTPQKLFGGKSWNFVEMFIALASTNRLFFIAVACALRLLWQLRVSIVLIIMGEMKSGLGCCPIAGVWTEPF